MAYETLNKGQGGCHSNSSHKGDNKMGNDEMMSYDPFTGQPKLNTAPGYIPGRLEPVTVTRSDGTTEQIDLRPNQPQQQYQFDPNTIYQQQMMNNTMPVNNDYYQQQVYQNPYMYNNQAPQYQEYNNSQMPMMNDSGRFFSNQGGFNPVNGMMTQGFNNFNPYLQSNLTNYQEAGFQNPYELMSYARSINPAGAGFNIFGGPIIDWYHGEAAIQKMIAYDYTISNDRLMHDLSQIVFTDKERERMLMNGSTYNNISGGFNYNNSYMDPYYGSMGYGNYYEWLRLQQQQAIEDHNNQVNVMVQATKVMCDFFGEKFDEEAARLRWDPQLQYNKRMQEEYEFQRQKDERLHYFSDVPREVVDRVTATGFAIMEMEQFFWQNPQFSPQYQEKCRQEQKAYFFRKIKENHDEIIGLKPGQHYDSIFDYFNNASNLNKQAHFAANYERGERDKYNNMTPDERFRMSLIHGNPKRLQFNPTHTSTVREEYCKRNGIPLNEDGSFANSTGGIQIHTTYDENNKPHQSIDIKRIHFMDDAEWIDDKNYDEAMNTFLEKIGGAKPEKILTEDGQTIYRITPAAEKFNSISNLPIEDRDPSYIGYHASTIQHANKFVNRKKSEMSLNVDGDKSTIHELISQAKKDLNQI